MRILLYDFATAIDKANWAAFQQTFLHQIPLTDQEIRYARDRAMLPLRHQGLGLLALDERIYTANYVACTSIATIKNNLEQDTWNRLSQNSPWIDEYQITQ